MFLHTYHPNPILLNFGPLKIYWYGFIIVVGMSVAFAISKWLLKKYQKLNFLIGINLADLALYLLIGGLLGARLFHIISEWQYYLANPFNIFKLWNGGLWIYGAIVGGLLGLLFFTHFGGVNTENKKKHNQIFLLLLDLLAPAVIIAQSIGRWGNYFNQELYGLPTNSILGLPIDFIHRISGFENFFYFHPVFLYESLWCLLVGIILIFLHLKRIKKYSTFPQFPSARNSLSIQSSNVCAMSASACAELKRELWLKKSGNIFLWYLFLYSLGRFFFEFLRIDNVFLIYSFRSTQIAAFLAIAISGIFLLRNKLHIN